MSAAAGTVEGTTLLDAWLAREDLLERLHDYNPAFGEFRRVLGHEDVARRLSLADVASMLDSPAEDIAAVAEGTMIAPARSRPMEFDEGGPPLPRDAEAAAIVRFDTRPIFERGHEPLPEILALLETIDPAATLVVEAPFHPAPLRRLLRRRGYRSQAEQLAADHWRCTFVPELAGTAGGLRLGVVLAADGSSAGAVLGEVARRLLAEGLRVVGVIPAEGAASRAGDRRCGMELDVLPEGPTIAIGQDLGAEARGCRLDSEALETAVALVDRALAPGSELLVVNKFGKRESEGAGFRQTIARALEMGVPVLVGVGTTDRPGLEAFLGQPVMPLPVDAEAILAWFRAGDGAGAVPGA